MKLKRLGFYKEMPYGDKNDPSIFQFIREKGEIEEEKIYQYLKEGIGLVACGAIIKDIINPDIEYAGVELLTDGIWVWPSDLSYYVKTYHLELNKDFIKTIKDNNWVIRDIPTIDYDDLEMV